MIGIVQHDWLLQSLMVLATVSFALVMRFFMKSGEEIATLLMQGLLAVSSIVVILMAFDFNIFSSVANHRSIMVIPAMMTLIYLGRDVFNSLSARHHDDK